MEALVTAGGNTQKRIFAAQLWPKEAVGSYDDKASKWDYETNRHIPLIPHPTHELRKESPTHDRHDDEGGG
jgi:hypothetical protein